MRQSQQITAHSAVTTEDKHYADENGPVTNQNWQASMLPISCLSRWLAMELIKQSIPATLNANSDQFGYSLTLTSNSHYQKQGEQGYSTKSAMVKWLPITTANHSSMYQAAPLDDITHQVFGKGWIENGARSSYRLTTRLGLVRVKAEWWNQFGGIPASNSPSGKASYTSRKVNEARWLGIAITQQDVSPTAINQTEIEGRDYPTEWQISIPSQQIELTVSALNPQSPNATVSTLLGRANRYWRNTLWYGLYGIDGILSILARTLLNTALCTYSSFTIYSYVRIPFLRWSSLWTTITSKVNTKLS